jgi:hypothetical protein
MPEIECFVMDDARSNFRLAYGTGCEANNRPIEGERVVLLHLPFFEVGADHSASSTHSISIDSATAKTGPENLKNQR